MYKIQFPNCKQRRGIRRFQLSELILPHIFEHWQGLNNRLQMLFMKLPLHCSNIFQSYCPQLVGLSNLKGNRGVNVRMVGWVRRGALVLSPSSIQLYPALSEQSRVALSPGCFLQRSKWPLNTPLLFEELIYKRHHVNSNWYYNAISEALVQRDNTQKQTQNCTV